jgi:hypothetical protein
MKKHIIAAIGVSSMLLVFNLIFPLESTAEVNVNVSIPLPGLVISAPPAMVVVPGTYVYYPPEVSVDIFFYRGYWYRPYQGAWYVAHGYNGPWHTIGVGHVPHSVIGVSPHYRHVSSGYERIPYGTVKGNWHTWERERYWEKHERSRGYHGDHSKREYGGPGYRR